MTPVTIGQATLYLNQRRMTMPKCENCGDEKEELYYWEWNGGTECGDLCEVCAEMFVNMENDDA